jgi:hypothetical protein
MYPGFSHSPWRSELIPLKTLRPCKKSLPLPGITLGLEAMSQPLGYAVLTLRIESAREWIEDLLT